MPWTEIVGKRFSVAELDDHLKGLSFGAWKPSFVVVHNTAVPSVAQRPHGFTAVHMQNLVAFYRDTNKWSAGPHAFVDQNGIWVFTPLTQKGVHSPSWNDVAWGVETLGDYESEPFDGAIKENLIGCLSVLHCAMGLDPTALRFHREDLKTSHKTCPGSNLRKDELIAAVVQRLSVPAALA